ncbi:MAG: cardiolipin synthase [Bacteroidales bacterium]|nr:cardiolipin synthase [Bacteroidales bacterium]
MDFALKQVFVLTIVLGTILVIISENRNPVKTIAWCMVLTFMPVIGLLLYILFGMDNRHRRLIKDEDLSRLKGITEITQSDEIVSEMPAPHKPLADMLRKMNKSFLLSGNDVEIMTDFHTMSDRLIADIEGARHHINMLFFKFEDDAAGRRIADALIRKAEEGVQVRLIYDDAGNLMVPRRFYKRLREHGIQVRGFIRIFLPILSRDYNSRNHRKVVVIDGKVGYMGGMNIAQRYAEGLKWGIWRDTHMRITGPAVSELQTSFLTDWKFTRGDEPDLDSMYPYNPPCGDTIMQIVTGGSMDKWNVMMQAYMTAIASARSYAYLQSPYFIPPEPIMKVLQNAALSGVDVRIMIPYRGDKGILPPWASRSYIKEALSAGIKIYLYRKGYMHAKTLVIDDSLVTIGSTNIDFRGFGQDFEINAFMYDESLARQQHDIFFEDQKDAELIDPLEWDRRPFLYKAKESVARIFSQVL